MKKIALLGCTGSVGSQTLDIVRCNSDKLKIVSLVAFSNEQKLAQQVAEFAPNYSALISKQGEGCLIEAVKNCDIAVVATKGITSIDCILYCLDNGIDVAVANKEALVCAGSLIMQKVGKAKLYPVDSEHCAISQCLLASNGMQVDKLLLTASGGPFWNTDEDQLQLVDATKALQHPNWNMGTKISIDSATMFNKALEVIEASWLFGIDVDNIDIVVHRQSIVHSAVQFQNGGVVAQLANPDMRLPIAYALLNEAQVPVKRLSFDQLMTLTFEKVNTSKFPCAQLGHEIKRNYPLAPTVMNSANDVCVDSFIEGRIKFTEFYQIIKNTVLHFEKQFSKLIVSVDNIKIVDQVVKQYVMAQINGDIC